MLTNTSSEIAKSRGFTTFAQDNHARPQEDIFTAFGLIPEQVAQHPDQITEDTKAYVGPLVYYDDQGKITPIFQRLQGVEIYASLERKIRRETLKIDGRLKSPEQALEELKQAGINRNVCGRYGKENTVYRKSQRCRISLA